MTDEAIRAGLLTVLSTEVKAAVLWIHMMHDPSPTAIALFAGAVWAFLPGPAPDPAPADVLRVVTEAVESRSVAARAER